MYGSGLRSRGGLTPTKLLNGYLNALANDTNTVTFAGLAETYSLIVYCVRDISGSLGRRRLLPWINYEGAADWLASPQFRLATNVSE
jgi:hypothetical protein